MAHWKSVGAQKAQAVAFSATEYCTNRPVPVGIPTGDKRGRKIGKGITRFKFRQIVPYVGDDEEYSQALEGLSPGVAYDLQIQALDRNSYVLYTSPEVRSTAHCLPPIQPPAQLTVDAPDPRHVRVTWVPLPESAWRCAKAQIELQVGLCLFLLAFTRFIPKG